MPFDIAGDTIDSYLAKVYANEKLVTTGLTMYIDVNVHNSYYPGSGSTWNDLAGSFNVTLYNAGGSTYTSNAPGAPTFSTGAGGFFTFDGSNDWGKFTQFTAQSNISVGAWVKTTSGGGIMSHCSGGPVNLAYWINGGKMAYYYYTNAWQLFTGNATVNDGNWRFLMWTKSGTSFRTYVDGVLDASTTLVGDVTGPLNAICTNWGPCDPDSYGAGTSSYGSVFNGSVGSIMVYNGTQLTAAQVLQNYYGTKNRFNL
jgi:hypothetical protein